MTMEQGITRETMEVQDESGTHPSVPEMADIPRQVLEKVSLWERQMEECGKTMAEIRELLTMARNSQDV
ncbi:MAG: hypothetical protein HFI92_10370 [Lachnospiraceae bacterium]|nr:hypothetical protein [Lachnospiraceae bacterium]